MDIDRLNLAEAAMLSRVIDLLGAPEAEEELMSRVNIIEAIGQLYRKELSRIKEANRRNA